VAQKENPYSVLVHTNKMFEYMALRRPVVASRLSSTASYFPEDAVAYFDPDNAFDLANTIREVLGDPDATALRVERASAHYERYRWENERRKYVGVYEDLLGSPLGQSPPSRIPGVPVGAVDHATEPADTPEPVVRPRRRSAA
jgi:hypothetical protein